MVQYWYYWKKLRKKRFNLFFILILSFWSISDHLHSVIPKINEKSAKLAVCAVFGAAIKVPFEATVERGMPPFEGLL